MGVRLYSPSSGRFLSTDPVRGGNANAYEYCVGDPINCRDTSGAMRWGSRSYSFWSPAWWGIIHFNKSETVYLAWGSGIMFNAVWYAGGKFPIAGALARRLLIAVEMYLFYFSGVAGYAAARGRCVGVMFYGRKYWASYALQSAYLPIIWTERC
ncbi:RHS repeat-associated core domain-containing protein [Streptomyces goshikiensis]|uniref:RHS repeat-associated core domain-containing protein n=1 Tax=Streptomyces goshikiensis TaxID=1942 RepID=UPI003991185F